MGWSLTKRRGKFGRKRGGVLPKEKGNSVKRGKGLRKGVPARGLEGGNELPAYPNLGVQLGCFLAQLEVENAVALAVFLHCAQDITCSHLLSLSHDDRREVAIDADVTAVTNKHILVATKLEDSRHHAVKDGAGTCSRLAHVVGTLVVELHITQTRHVILAKAVAYHVLAGDGNRQAALVLHEVAVELYFLGREPTATLGCRSRLGSLYRLA